MVHPDWDEPRVAEEVKRIQAETPSPLDQVPAPEPAPQEMPEQRAAQSLADQDAERLFNEGGRAPART
ncbi:hypothetical protein [Actinomadura rubrisoli]|uniref:Uncharacterized protein n=1 Tax=Actinomadura rubrisoli TaxID=2530368 RepID=A0A4R5CAR3_9ACTN|nr:hypothetical protein [Actinomadura rubrisoli]TDD94142.1 hypothetical protein E1298_07465 [Actinomadura rubrisoli]